MRALTVIALALIAPLSLLAPAFADDKGERERKVKVALALSATNKPAVTAIDESCGKCREDFAAAWDDALKEKRPLAVFVGERGCDGLGRTACDAGAVAVKVSKYEQPGKRPDEQRIVIGKPSASGTGFEVAATLPPKSKPETVADAVTKATPADAKPSHLPPVPKAALTPVKLDWLVK